MQRDDPLLDEITLADHSSTLQLWCGRLAMALFYGAFILLRTIFAAFILDRCCEEAHGAAMCATHSDLKQESSVQACASVCSTWTIVSMGALAIGTTSWLTAVSDQCGRKPVLIASVGTYLVGSIGYVVIAVADIDKWWLVLPSLTMGLGGSYGCFNAALFAWMADLCASPSDRSRAFSILEGCLFLGGSLGPLAGGRLMQRVSAAAAFGLVAALFGASLLCVLLLRESVPAASIRRAMKTGGGFCRLACSPLRLLSSRGAARSASSASSVGFVCLTFSIGFFAVQGFGIAVPLFTADALGFGPEDVGNLVACQFSAIGFALTLLLPAILRLATSPLGALVHAIRLGLLIICAGGTPLGLSTTAPQAFALLSTVGVGYIFIPATRGLLSSLVGRESQGKVLGLIANIEVFFSAVAPLVWGYVWRESEGDVIALTFYAIGGTCAVALAMSVGLRAPPSLTPGELVEELATNAS